MQPTQEQNKREVVDQLPQNGLSRRHFFATSQGVIAAAVLANLGVLTPLFARAASSESDDSAAPKWINAGKPQDYTPGSSRYFLQGKFFMVRMKDGGFIALSSACTHLGCKIRWVDEYSNFRCPCHSSIFDLDGLLIKGPAFRPLDYFVVSVQDGQLMVDISRAIKRKEFEKSQALYT